MHNCAKIIIHAYIVHGTHEENMKLITYTLPVKTH